MIACICSLCQASTMPQQCRAAIVDRVSEVLSLFKALGAAGNCCFEISRMSTTCSTPCVRAVPTMQRWGVVIGGLLTACGAASPAAALSCLALAAGGDRHTAISALRCAPLSPAWAAAALRCLSAASSPAVWFQLVSILCRRRGSQTCK